MVNVQLICAFVYAYTKSRFSPDDAYFLYVLKLRTFTDLTGTVYVQICISVNSFRPRCSSSNQEEGRYITNKGKK